MPQRRARPVRFAPKGCSDAVDGSSAFPGAMAQLANLAPDPTMNGSFVPRPGAYLDIDFAALGYTTPAFISSSSGDRQSLLWDHCQRPTRRS